MMRYIVAVGLLIFAAILFLLNKKGKISSTSLQTVDSITGIVALALAIFVLILPSLQDSNAPTNNRQVAANSPEAIFPVPVSTEEDVMGQLEAFVTQTAQAYTFSSARQLELDKTYNGSVTPSDTDYHEFTITSDETVNFHIQVISGFELSGLKFVVLDNQGKELEAHRIWKSEDFLFAPESGAVYYIGVSSWYSDLEGGSYRISVRIVTTPEP